MVYYLYSLFLIILQSKITTEIEEYEALEMKIEEMGAKEAEEEDFVTLEDIGSNCFLYATVPAKDKKQIVIHVGLGFFVETSLPDALNISDNRCELLHRKLEVVQANIEHVEFDLSQVQILIT